MAQVMTRIMARLVGVAGLIWLACLLSTAAARAAPAKPEARETPLHITALRLEADQKERVITFSGRVKAQYGDSTLYAERLRIFYKPAEGKAAQAGEESGDRSPLAELGGEKIDRIEAEGRVRFVQEDKVAAGDKAVYYRDEEKVVLLGNPRVWRGENILKGERITLYLKDNRVVVESSPRKRVEAHLYPAPGKTLGVGGLLPGGPRSPRKKTGLPR